MSAPRAPEATPLEANSEDVPIDVLAKRLGTTRGALFKAIHDARRKLRAALSERGLGVDGDLEGAP